ncbi:TonB family protein [Sphingobium sp. CAP-1]|nr:energy transducer TonB [Sphingobium sp. CAP-1]QGP80299.1 TonB family protein [Sphingobium sp. CAP-1]
MAWDAGQGRQRDGESRYGAGRKSPLGLGGTMAVHALVIGAFLLIPKEVIDTFRPTPPITTYAVPDDPPPPENPVVEQQADPRIDTRPQPRERPTATDPVIELPKGDPILTGGGAGDTISDPPRPYIAPPPIPEPVLTEASIDPRAAAGFQPDYPGTMIRQGVEGKVTVRVTIGVDGRVAAIEKIAATDDSFWLATQRHALRKWRFRPATRDGVAVSSTRVMTVRFTLTER